MTQGIEAEIAELEDAEDFLSYFEIEFDAELVQHKHIPLLRLFRNILSSYSEPLQHKDYKKALKIAYRQLANGNELAFAPSSCSGCTDCDD